MAYSDRPSYRSFDWVSLVKTAQPEPHYYDEYRFSGRTYRKRDVLEQDLHDTTPTPPTYTTINS